MKTTLGIQDDLLAEAKSLAARERGSMTALIEDGLRLRLRKPHCVGIARPPRVPIHLSGNDIPDAWIGAAARTLDSRLVKLRSRFPQAAFDSRADALARHRLRRHAASWRARIRAQSQRELGRYPRHQATQGSAAAADTPGMSKRVDFHRWDDVTPDTRAMGLHEDTVPQWSQSVHSNFAEPSRLGDLDRPAKPRRTALTLIVGVAATSVLGASAALLYRMREHRE
jgi:hypothetical protein